MVQPSFRPGNEDRNKRVLELYTEPGATFSSVAAAYGGISRQLVAGIVWRASQRKAKALETIRRMGYTQGTL